jgi:hypothetical protein
LCGQPGERTRARRLVRRDLPNLRRERAFGDFEIEGPCMFIQNSAPVLKNLPSRSAVSAVTGFSSRAMRSIRVRGTCSAAATA